MTPHDGTMFPRTFAILRDDRDAFLFDANYLRQARAAGGGGPEEVEICPHESNARYMAGFIGPVREQFRFRVQGRVRAFIIDRSDRQDYHDPWRYITPHRHSEMMSWRFTGAAVHLMTSPTPIPVLEVDIDLPCCDNNHVRLVPARRRDADIWWDHWVRAPESLIDRLNRGAAETDSEDEREVRRRRRREARQASGGAAAATVTPPPAAPIPKFVADALIRDAVGRAATCPITMDPLVAETTAVTTCFHLFERDAIAVWLVQSGDCCAVCKQRTAVTV